MLAVAFSCEHIQLALRWLSTQSWSCLCGWLTTSRTVIHQIIGTHPSEQTKIKKNLLPNFFHRQETRPLSSAEKQQMTFTSPFHLLNLHFSLQQLWHHGLSASCVTSLLMSRWRVSTAATHTQKHSPCTSHYSQETPWVIRRRQRSSGCKANYFGEAMCWSVTDKDKNKEKVFWGHGGADLFE